jgi:CMP-N-acetylneuraminic acid synthetase
MYQNKKIFCFIAARGGSKGLPGKNKIKIKNKPLIAYSIDIAKKVKYIDGIFVSTEDKKIGKIAKQYGANVIIRPEELSKDDSNILYAFKHLIQNIPSDDIKDSIIVIFWTTTPIRRIKDIENCIKMYDKNIDCVVSVMESKIRPSWLFVEKNKLLKFWKKGVPEPNRQQQKEKYFYINGSVVVTSAKFLMKQKTNFIGGKIKGYIMDEKHSMDIDTKFDYELCKYFLESK